MKKNNKAEDGIAINSIYEPDNNSELLYNVGKTLTEVDNKTIVVYIVIYNTAHAFGRMVQNLPTDDEKNAISRLLVSQAITVDVMSDMWEHQGGDRDEIKSFLTAEPFISSSIFHTITKATDTEETKDMKKKLNIG